MYQLRLLSTVMRDLDIHQLPIVFTGGLVDCANYASAHGYVWKRDSNVFGGYYVHKPSGCCLFVTCGNVSHGRPVLPTVQAVGTFEAAY